LRLIGTAALTLALSFPTGAAQAQALREVDASALTGWIAEAAQRFGIPEAWIRAVMRVESAFQVRAVSRAGAMGLMQVMPQTYAELRVRHGLGADPYDPRDNIMAGAAYLREMYDRFGAAGFLAAYNAGPARYQQHLAEGRALPLETRAYVVKLSSALVGTVAVAPPPRTSLAPPPTLFVTVGRMASGVDKSTPASSGGQSDAAHSPLFATLTRVRERP
jgi:soluble lytic murein transglycosylase-like protein